MKVTITYYCPHCNVFLAENFDNHGGNGIVKNGIVCWKCHKSHTIDLRIFKETAEKII